MGHVRLRLGLGCRTSSLAFCRRFEYTVDTAPEVARHEDETVQLVEPVSDTRAGNATQHTSTC